MTAARITFSVLCDAKWCVNSFTQQCGDSTDPAACETAFLVEVRELGWTRRLVENSGTKPRDYCPKCSQEMEAISG